MWRIFDKYINQKSTIALSLVMVIAMMLLGWLGTNYEGSCGYLQDNGHFVNFCEMVSMALLPVVPILIVSLVLLALNAAVFRAWSRFVCIWAPVSSVAIFLASNNNGLFLSDQEFMIFLSFSAFTTVTFLIVLVQSLRVYGRKN